MAVDLALDSSTDHLAAYQLSFTAKGIKIVGIEGGDAHEFQEPPYYDARAMQRDTVKLAAFSTAPAEQLPRGRFRVATIHVLVGARGTPVWEVDLQVAGNAEGQRIEAGISAVERKME